MEELNMPAQISGYCYKVRDKHRLMQLLATCYFGRRYFFYVTGYLNEEQMKDPEPFDAKMILTHATYYTDYRNLKYGSVKYLRMGRWWILMSSHAPREGSSFFKQEPNFYDIRTKPLVVGGYTMKRDKKTHRVLVRIHKNAYKELQEEIDKRYSMSRHHWEFWFRTFPYIPFSGVIDDAFSLLKYLNDRRAAEGLKKINWKNSIRTTFRTQECYHPTSKSMLELISKERFAHTPAKNRRKNYVFRRLLQEVPDAKVPY